MKDILIHIIRGPNPEFITLKKERDSALIWITDTRDLVMIGPFCDAYEATQAFKEYLELTTKVMHHVAR